MALNTIKETVYKDLNLSFDAHPITGAVGTLINVDAIKRALKTLVLISRGEIPYNSNIGSTVKRLLFSNYTNITKIVLSETIQTVISNYEPRAKLLDVIIDDDPDRGAINITIIFQPHIDVNPVKVSFFLERIR